MRWALLCALAASCATTKEQPTEAPAGTFHTMQPGETVWDLSRQTGLPVDEIVEVNGLQSANDVAAGQVLFLPAAGADRPVVDAPAPHERAEVPEANASASLRWPVDGGVVLRDFSPGKYDGILIAAPADTPVLSAADGKVAFVGDEKTAYGLLVVVESGDITTVYGHLSSARVKAGDVVKAGDAIGVVGTTGGAESPRLHFQVRRARTVVDPLRFLP
jgi:murein DD-endopeptidase MepM/ murein hydrolase activator NlpD